MTFTRSRLVQPTDTLTQFAKIKLGYRLFFFLTRDLSIWWSFIFYFAVISICCETAVERTSARADASSKGQEWLTILFCFLFE